MSFLRNPGPWWRFHRRRGLVVLVLVVLTLGGLWCWRGRDKVDGGEGDDGEAGNRASLRVGEDLRSMSSGSNVLGGRGRALVSEKRGPPEGVHFNGQHLAPVSSELARVQWRGVVANIPRGEKRAVILGFRRGLSEREELVLGGLGVEIKGYVPSGGYLARLGGASSCEGDLFEELCVVAVLDGGLKVDPVLVGGRVEGRELGLRVHVWSEEDLGVVAKRFEEAGFGGWTAGGGAFSDTLVNRLPGVDVGRWISVAAGLPEVIRVEPAGSARLMNNNVQSILQSGAAQGSRPFFDAGIYGSNQVIAICDTGIDLDSCYFRDGTESPAIQRRVGNAVNAAARKVIAVDFWQEDDDPNDPTNWDEHGHGTMVAGCAGGWKVGLPYASPSYHGMAPGSRLVIQDCGYVGADVCADLIGLGCPVTNFLPVLRQAYAQGARVHNNSWGDMEEIRPHNLYSEPTRELDSVVWEHRDLLVVCAAGNDALINMVDSPSVAKNGLSVGATGNGSGLERITSFSSRGWASDGRWKPDLVAPGESIISAASDFRLGTDNCGVTLLSGTSFSSPAVAGMAALVRDYFAQGFYPYRSPGGPSPLRSWSGMSAALVKAVLIQSTVPVALGSGPIPGRDQGWGRVNLSKALPLKDGEGGLWVRDEQGGFPHSAVGSHVVYVKVRSSQQPLKVTLVWTDPPATVGADFHLMNDLDLHLRSGSRRWVGNQFQGGWSVEGEGRDGLNNVERILISTPQVGVYELEVEPVRVLPGWGPQDFALVSNGDMEVIPAGRDEDQDGMADGWELLYWGNLSRDGGGDADGDGVSDRDEYGAGTDPTDAESALRLTARILEGGLVELQCVVPRDRDVTVEFSDVLPAGNTGGFRGFENRWVIPEARLKVDPDVRGGRRVRVVDDYTGRSSGSVSPTGARYYRLRSVPSVLP